jgi:protein-S-isoprenylcysteine O-methyltransferase Ste14
MTVQALLPAYGALLVAFLALRSAGPRLLAASARGALATWSLVLQLDLLVQLPQRTPSVHLSAGLPVGAAVFAWLGLGTRRVRWPGLAWMVAAGVSLGALQPASPGWVAIVLFSSLVGAWSGFAIEEDRHRALRSVVHWTSFLGAFALVVPAALAGRFGPAPSADGWTGRGWVALLLVTGGMALAAWATTAFHRAGGTPEPLDPPARLCTHGPYRWVRHPLQLAEMALVWAGVLLQWSTMGALYAVGFCAFLKGPLRWHEERVLERRFGPAARDFRDAVPAYVPRVWPRRLTASLPRLDAALPPAEG